MFQMIFSDKVKNRTVLQRHRNIWAFVVIVCLAAYALGANPFAGQTVAPLDLLIANPGWSSIQADVKVVHSESSDIVDSQLPTWIPLKAQIREGRGALWWPYGTGGQPISFELLNPAFLLFVVVKDNALAYYLVCLFKLVISGFGGYLLLRTFLRWMPSVWGGAVYMLCGFNAAWFFWDQVATSMWIPWLLAATVMYLKTEEMKWLPAISVTSLLLIFGAFPSVAAFGFYSFALLVLFWNIWGFFVGHQTKVFEDTRKLKLYFKKAVLPVLAVGLAFLMSAITLVPFIDSMSGIDLSYRAGTTETGNGALFGAGTQFNGGLRDLLLFLLPENPPKIERTAYIGIPVFLLALSGIFSAFRSKDEKLRRFVLINLLLVIITILIAFGFLPHRLIRAIPVFNNNSWGRLIVITLLGLAVLSAFGLDFLVSTLPRLFSRYLKITPSNAQRILAVLAIVIFALQFHSQKKLFNSFNAVVPAAWFYPLTPSIKYVKEHLKPLQSVIADHSFNLSGTLGAYGIAQWYSHSFKTEKEKEVLSSLVRAPFPSPTSSMVLRPNINFNSPLMEKLAIKYLLVNKDVLEPIIIHPLSEISPPLPEITHSQTPPLPDNSLKQHIYLPADITVRVIGFWFTTNGREHAPADVRLTLRSDQDNKYVMGAELDKNKISDNQWAFFEFPDKVNLKKGAYSLVLELVNYAGPEGLAVWATEIKENKGNYLEINGTKTEASLKIKMGIYEKRDMTAYTKKWNILSLEKDIVIFENRQVTNSAYFVKDLEVLNDQTDFSGLDVKQQSADLIDIRSSKTDPGWIVLPMHLHSGWKAYVNDRRVGYDTYLGILPAIPVHGPSQVIFKYQPESFRRGLLISLTGILMFLVFLGYCFKRMKQAQ